MILNASLAGKRALVTGASRGIGSAIALELARVGAEIVLHYAGNERAAKETAAKIEEIGGKVALLKADLSMAEGADGLIEKAGNVDILVLNASVQIRKSWTEITDADFNTQINCNLRSSMKLIQQAVPYMKAQKWGRIVAIGSVQEISPHPDMLIYSCSKAAQTMMVKSLALQLAADGITINNVAPGVIDTDRNKDALANAAYAKKVLDKIPVGFYGEKEDVSPLVRLICTDEGRYITGQTIFIDGGMGL